ncbi:hypothetical protein VNI00_017253 [Paramarasmius palmivorus]|uniref:Uncharacterized protein n=1 Tax=Paramarasmius palmivorus TaxID=297713 RepID=A0AAW0B6Q2_9AGAR
MAQDIEHAKSMFIALWTQTMLYGVNTVLFVMCVYVLVRNHKKQEGSINKPLLITSIILYTLCSAHVINDLSQAISAFITYEDKGGAMIYRLYIVWNYNVKIIVGPLILLAATTGCGGRAVWAFSNIKQGQDTYAIDIYTWGIALFTLSLCQNLLVTSLIAGRIWWCGKKLEATLGRKHTRKYGRAMVIFVESGALYSFFAFLVLITYALKTNSVVSELFFDSLPNADCKQFIAYDALAQVMGINPILIIVRVGLGLTSHDTTYQTTTRQTDTLFARTRAPRPESRSGIQVHKVTEVDTHGRQAAEDIEIDLDDMSQRSGKPNACISSSVDHIEV